MRLEAYWHNKNFPDARSTILAALGIDGDKIPRERAVYIGEDGPIIHTRTGGGNREQYDTPESFIEGDYGLDNTIAETTQALTDYEDWRWKTDLFPDDKYENTWSIPYEVRYKYPETEAEWQEKELEIRSRIKELEEQKVEVLETHAYTNDYLRNDYYLRDEDDDFDQTYADFFYRWPDGLKAKLIKDGYLEEDKK